MRHTVTLKNGETVPALGCGTWYLGDNPSLRAQEVRALRAGIGEGMTLIDTAEMYGGGRSEALVGEVIREMPRKDLYLVSKVMPGNAGRKRLEGALDETLLRMGVDELDLYLYHWRGSVPLAETVGAMQDMVKKGKIKAWGVSNFDIDDMEELFAIPGGDQCLVNQVLYHVASRGIEYSLLPWMREHGVALMAYCPLAQGGTLEKGLLTNNNLISIARRHNCSVPQVLLAWCIRDGHTIAIPRTGKTAHALDNARADDVELTEEDLALIDSVFAPPTKKTYLDMQ